MTPSPLIRVFLSYSWDSEPHKRRVLELAQRLRREGVDASLDRFTLFPEKGWLQWMADQVEEAAFVLVVSTAAYKHRFERKEETGRGLGVTWEGAIITQELYEGRARNTKFVPLIFEREDVDSIPRFLRSATYFDPTTDEGYDALYRYITGQPEIVPALIGPQRRLKSDLGVTGEPLAAKAQPLRELPVHSLGPTPNNLPRHPYFFGRESELSRIAGALLPQVRSWGVAIDGPGGIGKTALAVRAAELAPPGRFKRIIYLSAKEREFTADGERARGRFVQSSSAEMLTAIAREIGLPQIAKAPKRGRSDRLRRALVGANVLLVLDNVESLSRADRDELFDFLNHLPPASCAIVTGRPRAASSAINLRLDRLEWSAAAELLQELGKQSPRLHRANNADRRALYDTTGGNPLLIRWAAGQIEQGRCRDVASALMLMRNAPPDNNPLAFVFRDLVEGLTAGEINVVAALSHFTCAVEPKFVAEIAALDESTAQKVLCDLSVRAMVLADIEEQNFALVPMVADFIGMVQPDTVANTAKRLEQFAFARIVENGRDRTRFALLDAIWPKITAALASFHFASSGRLQMICNALADFCRATGRLHEWNALNRTAEKKARDEGDYQNAGWRAYHLGISAYSHHDADEVLSCAGRLATYWRATPCSRERALIFQLRGHGNRLKANYLGAIAQYQEALVIARSLEAEKNLVSTLLSDLAEVDHLRSGDSVAAERSYQEALSIAIETGFVEGVARVRQRLANLALERKDSKLAEVLARDALPLAEEANNQELLATSCFCLATVLVAQGKPNEATPYARRAVEIFKRLNHADLHVAKTVLAASSSGGQIWSGTSDEVADSSP